MVWEPIQIPGAENQSAKFWSRQSLNTVQGTKGLLVKVRALKTLVLWLPMIFLYLILIDEEVGAQMVIPVTLNFSHFGLF